jgi:hypothetical protein
MWSSVQELHEELDSKNKAINMVKREVSMKSPHADLLMLST